jgi:hypothetical protein
VAAYAGSSPIDRPTCSAGFPEPASRAIEGAARYNRLIGMPALSDRAGTWGRRLALAAFLLSFFVPAVRLGGPTVRPALGVLAALLSVYVLPLAVRAAPASGRSPAEWAFMIVMGVYFALLFLQNLVMLYALKVAATAGAARSRRLRRLIVPAALLALGVPLVDFRRLFAGLGLTDGEAVRMQAGYYLWAGSFVLLAASLLPKRTPTS